MGKSLDRRRGITLAWTVISVVIFVGFMGFACDVAWGLLVAHQLQNAADAAALAGAMEMKTNKEAVRVAAVQLGAANAAANASVLLSPNTENLADGDVVIGRYNLFTKTFTNELVAANSVKVVARRTDDSLNGPLTLFFGRIFGVNTVNLSRTAIAQNKGATGAGLIALCPDCPSAFHIQGTADLVLNFGAIQVNSSDECAMTGVGDPTVVAEVLNITGGICAGPNVNFPENINTGEPTVLDPIAYVPEPTWDPTNDLGSITESGVYSPGYYSGGVYLTGGDVTLEEGIYILDGAGLQVGGNTNFTADGVMLYIPPGTGFTDITGTGFVHISPPNPELYSYPGVETYENLSIFQSRTNSNPGRIIGTSGMDMDGAFYFPAAHMDIGGTGSDLGSQVVAYTLEVFGTGVSISWDGSFPGLGNVVYLVE